MTELKTVIDFFENKHLNEVGSQLIDLYRKYNDDMQIAQNKIRSAIERRWLAGSYVSENIEDIIEECGTQRAFGERLGLTEATVSNDKRAYEALKKEGVTNVEDLIPFLKKRNISPTTYYWERMETTLNEPDKLREKDHRPKDEKMLEEYHSKIEEIKVRNEGANPAVAERAQDTLKYLEDVERHIGAQDVYKSGWRSRDYLDFVKSIGWDYITGQQAEHLDPHHVLPTGSTSGPHGKVADIFTIPVTRSTHNKLHEKKLTSEDRFKIAEALVRTMALYIITHKKGDNNE